MISPFCSHNPLNWTQLGLLFLLGALPLRAQPFIGFDHYTQEDGLSQSTVTTIGQDQHGFIWAGTLDGLNRFDGYQFGIYRHIPDDPLSLSGNHIRTLMVDSNNQIWIGTLGDGISRFDTEANRFQKYVPSDFIDVPDNRIYALAEDRDGFIWVGMRGVLSRFDPVTEQWSTFSLGSDKEKVAMHIAVDQANVVWVATLGGGLLQVDQSRSALKIVAQLPGSNKVRCVYPDSNGAIWLGSEDEGLFRFNPKENEVTRVDAPIGSVNDILEDKDGSVWVATGEQGIFIFPKQDSFFRVLHDPSISSSLPDNQVTALFRDRTGIIWVGTDNGGLSRCYRSSFQHYRRTSQSPLSDDAVWSILEDSSGILWIGTSNGLNRMNRETDEVIQYQPDPTRPGTISDKRVRASFEDTDGSIWFGTSAGLNHYIDGRFRNYWHNQDDPNSLASDVITAIYRDSIGHLWIGTNILLHRMESQEFIRYDLSHGSLAAADGYGYVTSFHENKENLWVGTFGGGLHATDRDRKTFKQFRVNPELNGVGRYDTVTTIWEFPGEGILWLGTYGGGLLRFEIKSGSFSVINSDQGLPNDTIYGLLGDESGHLWMSTNKGIVRYHPQSRVFMNYVVADGVQSEEFNRGSFFKSKSGEMFFGGIKGFNTFFPKDVRNDPMPPNIVLTDFLLFNKSGLSLSPFKPFVFEAESVTLTHSDRIFTIEFLALHFANPDMNRYAYRLDPVEDWQETSSANRSATYADLDPGEYTFHVRASNKDGVWNEEGIRLALTVQPPYWLTWWAKLFYITIVIGALFLFYHRKLARERRISQQERQMAEQERRIAEQAQAAADHLREFNATLDQKVMERTADLSKAHKQLEEQARRLEAQAHELREANELKTRFFTNISHELRTPLTLILGPLQDAHDKGVKDLPLDTMLIQARRLQDLINQLLDISKLEDGKMSLDLRGLDLIAFIRARVFSFSSLAESRNIRLGFHTDHEKAHILFDPDKMEQVIYNLISNAFKFTAAHDKINVLVKSESDDWLTIIVRDTGAGISEAQVPYVFDRFYQGREPDSKFTASTGIGLAHSQELVLLHEGGITVTSEEGFGSEFVVRLPWRKPDVVSEQEPPPRIPVIDVIPIRERLESPSGSPDQGAHSVVLIEDHPDIRAYMCGHLEGVYRVFSADCGLKGVDLVRAQLPDLVVCDVMMPDIDGFEVCRILRSDSKTSSIPIMLVTAKDSVESKTTGWEMGADAYLVKPFATNELLARAANLIDIRNHLRRGFGSKTGLAPSEIAVTPADEVFLNQVKDLLENRFSDSSFGVYEFAEEIGLSRRQLLRKVTAITGMGPADFLREFRLSRAAQLLDKKAGNVSEITYAVGFKSSAYFAARFKERYGQSPSEYAAKDSGTAKGSDL